MRQILLISSSRVHGFGYLEHCAGEIQALLSGCTRVLFVPWAQDDHDGYAKNAEDRFGELGFGLDSIHRATDPVVAVRQAEAVFIGGGNTFRLLKTLWDTGVVESLRERARSGMPYMGTSAGSNVACATINTTNDMPIFYPPTFEALRLVPFNINPHYLDPDPDSKHKGETRETRIREFHEVNERPVVGLREGSMLRIEGGCVRLLGAVGARLFRRGEEAGEWSPGADLSFLLA